MHRFSAEPTCKLLVSTENLMLPPFNNISSHDSFAFCVSSHYSGRYFFGVDVPFCPLGLCYQPNLPVETPSSRLSLLLPIFTPRFLTDDDHHLLGRRRRRCGQPRQTIHRAFLRCYYSLRMIRFLPKIVSTLFIFHCHISIAFHRTFF